MRYLIYTFLICLLAACNGNYKNNIREDFKTDSVRVIGYIIAGNTVYAEKSGYDAFAKSMLYYDSAWQIAQKNGDTLLLAASYFAKGRAYDAWNKEPQKTIEYYSIAADFFRSIPAKYQRSLYLKHLVAHAYDKLHDSVNTVKILTGLYDSILNKPDSVKQQLDFTSEMALISTEVKNYYLAENILQHLTKRNWIKNDSGSYDYLNHYYMTQSRIEVYSRNNKKTPFLDSLEAVFNHSKNLSDSDYYCNELRHLHLYCNNSIKTTKFSDISRTLYYKMNAPAAILDMQKTLNQIDNGALQREMEMKKEQLRVRSIFTWLLIALLCTISALTVFLIKKNREVRKKRNELFVSNKALAEKNVQNELLNKEIHHRVKNNLQMILSLVYMQERKTESEETKANLQDIRLRIESIAALHRQLMEQGEMIDLKKYITQLVSAVTSLVGNGISVVTHLQIEPIELSGRVSFSIGLILNECITNSVKYAKTDAELLQLHMQIKQVENTLHISYKDSGFSVAAKPAKEGLGLNIITLLSNQLGASVSHNPCNYFDYYFIIPQNNGG